MGQLDSTTAPLDSNTSRIDSLDLLRGSAILGILLMNTQSMGMPSTAYYNPTFYGTPDELNYIVFVVVHILIDVKMLSIFSMMFGAGMLLQEHRLNARGQSAWGVHYRRMLILLLLGLIHAYAFWYGDILVPYAMCGMLLFPWRRLPPTVLIVGGVICVSMVVLIKFGLQYQLLHPEIEYPIVRPLRWLSEQSAKLTEPVTSMEFELRTYRGGWWQQMDNRAPLSFDNETTSFAMWSFWRYGGCMLIGMGLHKLRFFHGAWPRESYKLLAALCIPAGWFITGAGVLYSIVWDWDQTTLYYTGELFNYFGSLITAIGYMGLGVLIAQRIAEGRARLLRFAAVPIRAVGKTALSNYIMQAVICTTLFYGHGFGWFGYLTRVQLVYIVLCVWALQLIVSTIWTSVFKQGPLEWVWHRLAHGSRRAAIPSPAGIGVA